MHFTLFSVIVLAGVGLAVFKGILKGRKQGLSKSLISLAVLLTSAVIAAVVAVFVSDIPTSLLADGVLNSIPIIDTYSEAIPSLEDIAVAAFDGFITPIVFILLLPPIMLLVRAIVGAVCKNAAKKNASDPSHVGSNVSPCASDNPSYVKKDAPWHVRNDRALGGAVRGFCAFLSFIMMMSPVIGTLSIMSNLYRLSEDEKFSFKTIRLKGSAIDTLEPYINDSVIATLNFTGGKLIYDGVATSVLLDDNTISVGHELDYCIETINDLYSVLKTISSGNELSSEQKKTIDNIGKSINKSDAMRMIAADFVNGACKKWIEGEKYLSISRPKCSKSLEPLLDGILRTCALSTPYCVGDDLTTLLNIYKIINQEGLGGGMASNELAHLLEDKGLLEEIYEELSKNSCMSHLTEDFLDTTLHLMASTIDLSKLPEERRQYLMTQLADSLNRVNSNDNAEFSDKVEDMKEYTLHFAKQCDINLPESVTEMAVTSMLRQLDGVTDYDAQKMDKFLEYHSTQKNSEE